VACFLGHPVFSFKRNWFVYCNIRPYANSAYSRPIYNKCGAIIRNALDTTNFHATVDIPHPVNALLQYRLFSKKITHELWTPLRWLMAENNVDIGHGKSHSLPHGNKILGLRGLAEPLQFPQTCFQETSSVACMLLNFRSVTENPWHWIYAGSVTKNFGFLAATALRGRRRHCLSVVG